MKCDICPRRCNIDRCSSSGYCGAGDKLKVAKAYLHKWEEPCISGTNGSGAVFFTGCNLKCVFCQNYVISRYDKGKEISMEGLRSIISGLKSKGAHNINLVSPTHYIRQIRECITGMPCLEIPVVYNTNGYESRETLELAEGIADVYLPDLKYYSSEVSGKYSGAEDYFAAASKAILEMYRQVGPPVLDDKGLIIKGLIIRHLILPGNTKDSINVLKWISENLPRSVYVSLMSQYVPCHLAGDYPQINRRITRREYDRVLDCFFKLGFENGYVQERDSANEEYIPEFDFEGIEEVDS